MLLDRIFHRRPPPPPPLGDLIHWDESFSVGNGLIDNEHREIVTILNALYDDWRSGAHHLDVTRILRRLDATARVHFSNEEEVLARHRCPTLAEHQAEHTALLAELAAIAANLPTLERDEAEKGLTRFVRRMVLDHILSTDMDAKHFLRE
jgi:hemerythrin-like metal-binding protein